MKIEKIKENLKDWAHEVSNKYNGLVVSEYEEPVNNLKEKIFLIDVLLKKNVQLDNYGYVISLRILKIESMKLEITVDICEGDGNILKERIYTINQEILPDESVVY